MPPSYCLFLLKARSLVVDVVGERIDAKTCDCFATGEDR